MKTSLVIMAAGIGSRFGEGIKQLAPVGPNGEIIMDYSIHDALEAGFDRVIFIIRREIEEEFKRVIGARIEKRVPVSYAYQELWDLPAGYQVPEGRKKPWGTGQAVLAVKGLVDGPFLVINADDYYGKQGFRALHAYMTRNMSGDPGIYEMCMAGYVLSNTLSDNGAVTRGVCRTGEDGFLQTVTETFDIRMEGGKLLASDSQGRPVTAEPSQTVSMNMWGLPLGFLKELENRFPKFLDQTEPGNLKAEFLLPQIIDDLIREGKARVKVLPTPDKWYGVTYKEDRQAVADAVKAMIEAGIYKENLYA